MVLGQPGTGIVWVTDVEAGLKAYKAIPDSDGNLVRINIPPTGGLNKFLRPAFGDGRVYVTDNKARVICLGSPVSLPLNCTWPRDFGDVTFGSTKTLKVDCTALIAITKINGASTLDPVSLLVEVSDQQWLANAVIRPSKSAMHPFLKVPSLLVPPFHSRSHGT